MEQSDSELVAACRRGDATAWEALVLRYQRLVYTIPSRAGLDEQLAADVFQTVFAKLVEHLPRLEQPDRIHAWLVTTAKRETWRHTRLRSAAAAQISTDDEDALELPADEPLPAETLQRLEDQHLVRVALARLEDSCRKLLTHLFYRDAPPDYNEVAAALSIPKGSIGPTRARCLQKLRNLLAEIGF